MRRSTPAPRNRLALSVTLIAVGVTSTLALGQAPPATQPGSVPTTVPTTAPVAIDSATPRGAVRTFAKALDVGDANALQAVVFAGNDIDRRMVNATIDMAVAMSGFRQASVAMFGKAE